MQGCFNTIKERLKKSLKRFWYAAVIHWNLRILKWKQSWRTCLHAWSGRMGNLPIHEHESMMLLLTLSSTICRECGQPRHCFQKSPFCSVYTERQPQIFQTKTGSAAFSKVLHEWSCDMRFRLCSVDCRGGRYDQNLTLRYDKFYITITIYITV